MPTESQSELFIRSLTEALEADRFIERTMRSLQSEERTARFMELSWSDLSSAMRTLDPTDRAQRTTVTTGQGPRIS